MARERRTKKEAIIAKISDLDEKITGHANKIAELTDQKEELEQKLEAILEAEKQAEQNAQLKEVVKIMKANKVSVDELRRMVDKQ